MTLYLGIDVGLTGCVVFLGETIPVTFFNVPTIKVKSKKQYLVPGMVKILKEALSIGEKIEAGLEKVNAFPGQGVTSMFNFGRGLGLWEGILSTLEIPYTKISPVVWKKEVGILGTDKNASIVRALQLYPKLGEGVGRNHNRADALLIAHFLKQKGERLWDL